MEKEGATFVHYIFSWREPPWYKCPFAPIDWSLNEFCEPPTYLVAFLDSHLMPSIAQLW